jgi:2,3-bisphosphoglycerate-independent phosphoglycerate mutase
VSDPAQVSHPAQVNDPANATRPATGARPRPLVLVIVDGFGIGPVRADDAIASARMPAWRQLLAEWPHTTLRASEDAVGLPAGQMGNSEVGHLNLGAGRPVVQDLPRIDAAIEDGSFFENPVLARAVGAARNGTGRLHLIGLVGPGGVHSTDRHAVALAQLAARHGVPELFLHGLLDGRDTPQRSAEEFLPDLAARLAGAHPRARIATIGGRYFAMDRDQRWDRVKQGYDAIVHADGLHAPTVDEALATAYGRGENDEFVKPTVIDLAGSDSRVRDGDVVIHFNFRADRARQLTHALVDGDEFTAFDRGERPKNLTVVTMTEYEEGLAQPAFPPMVVTSLAEIFSGLGWRQFHVAETEKYAHVTYFFNGGVEQAWPGEDRQLIPSQKVATYDLAPEMSAEGVTDALVPAITSGTYDFIVANYANPDMVGHTGIWEAAVKASETVDACLARVIDAVEQMDAASTAAGGPGALLAVTADHGNADQMRDAAGNPVTAHSLNPVPFVLCGSAAQGLRLHEGVLADVAPTLLELLGVLVAAGMTGRSLVKR